MAEAANDDFGQAMELVEKAFRGLRPHLYCRDEGGRRSFYAILLGELCDLLTIDGGPTHARIALEIGVKNMRADEERRGSTELAPFLTPEECKALIDDPHLDLLPEWRSKRMRANDGG